MFGTEALTVPPKAVPAGRSRGWPSFWPWFPTLIRALRTGSGKSSFPRDRLASVVLYRPARDGSSGGTGIDALSAGTFSFSRPPTWSLMYSRSLPAPESSSSEYAAPQASDRARMPARKALPEWQRPGVDLKLDRFVIVGCLMLAF